MIDRLQHRPAVKQFLKYCLTGVVNTGVTYIIYACLVLLAALPAVGLVAGYVAGMVSSYVINSRWTFQSAEADRNQIGRFALVNLVVLLLSEGTLRLILQGVTHSPYLAQAINVIPITILGFLANKLLVFQFAARQRDDSAPGEKSFYPLLLASVALAAIQLCVLVAGAFQSVADRATHASWPQILWLGWAHWDSSWYIQIAQSGYTSYKHTAFFPLYPMAIRVVHTATGLGAAASGVLISSVSFVIALWGIGMLTVKTFGRSYAIGAMMLLAMFPTAYYFHTVYTESLFLALSVWAVYFSFEGRFWAAGTLAMLATVTRNTGLLLVIILGMDYLRHRQMGIRFWKRSWWTSIDLPFIGVLLPIPGGALYAVWLKWKFGSYLAFMHAEADWHRVYMPLWETGWLTVQRLVHHDYLHAWYYVLECGTLLFALVLVAVALRYVRLSLTHVGWLLYLIAVLWITSTQPSVNIRDYLVSFPRYVLMLFPGFIYLAVLLRNKWVRSVITVGFACLLFTLCETFFSGVWIA